MTNLQDVQAALITKLKAATTVTTLLKDPKEIREIEWVGSVYTFPNIRVRVMSFQRKDSDCNIFNVTASILIFGEDSSSKLTNTIASAVFDLLDRNSLTSATVKSVTRMSAVQVGADYLSEAGLWQSEVNLAFQVT